MQFMLLKATIKMHSIFGFVLYEIQLPKGYNRQLNFTVTGYQCRRTTDEMAMKEENFLTFVGFSA
jgi:hypothetical protein